MAAKIFNLRTWRKIKASKVSLAGAAIIALFTLTAAFAPLLAPAERGADPYLMPQSGYSPEPAPPSAQHIFGTAEQQYDIFHGIVWGCRTAFKTGASVVAVSAFIGILLGGLAGYAGGKTDEALMRITDIVLSFPSIVLAVVIVAMLGPGLYKVMIALAAVSWPAYARLVRGDVMSIKQRDFVTAAKALGAGHGRIFFRHILPNSIYPVVIVASLDTGAVVLTAAALSFLGLGSPVGYADWGQLIAMSRNWILGTAGNPFAYWYTVTVPGGAIFLFVLGWNLLGDAFRDIADPKQY
ncbi:MAG: ABC transporter permease [Elusimicrobiaceae bacterium]|nr:ABC transporter permease [Elusimicrobiaceae bacterium]